jgi:hypothetical protein
MLQVSVHLHRRLTERFDRHLCNERALQQAIQQGHVPPTAAPQRRARRSPWPPPSRWLAAMRWRPPRRTSRATRRPDEPARPRRVYPAWARTGTIGQRAPIPRQRTGACRDGGTSAAGPGVHVGPGDRPLRVAVGAEHHHQRGGPPIGGLPHLRVQFPGRLRVLRRRHPPPGAAAGNRPTRPAHPGYLHLASAGAALLLDAVGVPLAAAVIVGVAATLLVYGLHMLWMYRRRRPATA